jgi:hypothetical protein
LDEFDEKPNHSKISKKHLIKRKCSMGSKCLTLDLGCM